MSEDQFIDSIFPIDLLGDLMRIVGANKDKINVLTYHNLDWGGDWDYSNHYAGELKAWKSSLKNGRQDPNKIHVFLQHDVDNCPDRTMDLLAIQERCGVPSNVMIFNHKIDRKHLAKTGDAIPSIYPIDHSRLSELESRGFVIGYHSNAYEQSEFDKAKAEAIFVQDVEEMRKKYNVQVFCPHGGARDPDGFSNAAIDLPAELRNSIRWVLNKHTIRLDGRYSDGAIQGAARDPENRDLRSHVLSWKPGKRYRILVHPQYYGSTYTPSNRLLEHASWYSELLDCYRKGCGMSQWWGPVAKKLDLQIPGGEKQDVN